jgi:hypothetical protein
LLVAVVSAATVGWFWPAAGHGTRWGWLLLGLGLSLSVHGVTYV